MRKLLLAVVPLLGACAQGTQDKNELAREGCRAVYDRLQRFVTGNGRFPESDAEWAEFESTKDPWGNVYVVDTESGETIVWSFGADGEEGTDDDIGYP